MILRIMALVFLTTTAGLAQPVIFDVNTNHPGDTIYLGNPAEIRFDVDAGPHELIANIFAFAFVYSNGNLIGPTELGSNFFFSDYANSVFSTQGTNPFLESVQVPDSFFFASSSFGNVWIGSHNYAYLQFNPTDTGTIFFDTSLIPPANITSALDANGQEVPLDWRPGPIVVAPCPWVVGDLNGNGVVTLGDVIMVVNYVFKQGAVPQPYELVADADCSEVITSADIIYLVNYQGKGGPEPCPCFIPPN
jgi:hypothetical protein